MNVVPILSTLAEKAGVPAKSVPTTPDEIEKFVRQHVYRGLSSRQRSAMEYKGQRLRLNLNLFHWRMN